MPPRTTRVRDRMRPGAVAVAWDDGADVALARMQAASLDAVPVVKDGRVIGLLERHAAAHARPSGRGDWSDPIRVAGLMRRGVFVCRADDPLGRALATMDRLEVSLLAVVDGAGRVVGAIDCDADDDPLRRLVPAFYGSY